MNTASSKNALDVPEWVAASTLRTDLLETPALHSWLNYRGLLTERLQEQFGQTYTLRIVEQRRGIPDASELAALQCDREAMLVREIELLIGDKPMVFAQTLVPDSTLQAQPWLATLGGNALGERMTQVDAVERGEFECANLQSRHALWKRALRNTAHTPKQLWARRSWFSIAGSRLLVTEIFLPEFAACIRGP